MVSTNELLSNQRKLTNLHDLIKTKVSEHNTCDDYQVVIETKDAIVEVVMNWIHDNVKSIEFKETES